LHCQLFLSSGQRSAKVMANVFNAGFHRAAQNVEHCGFAGAGCAELSYSGIPRDYALEIPVSAVSSLRCDSA
jgi:hypothetical protein